MEWENGSFDFEKLHRTKESSEKPDSEPVGDHCDCVVSFCLAISVHQDIMVFIAEFSLISGQISTLSVRIILCLYFAITVKSRVYHNSCITRPPSSASKNRINFLSLV